MIVRDEEAVLERCLESVKGFPDEIIIVDTGSKDRTKEIARRWTDQVYDFTWIDDFSAARNFSFSKATMDFICWLDADDVVSEANRLQLIDFKARLQPEVDGVVMDYHTAFDQYGNVTISVRRVRIVNRHSHYRWMGVVHENLWMIKGKANPHVIESDIVIEHRSSRKEPTKRNLDIYEKHLAKGNKLTSQDLFHYAMELKVDQQYEKAIDYYHQFLEREGSISDQLLAFNHLSVCYHMLGDTDKELELTLRSFTVDTPRPEFCCRLAEFFLKKKQVTQAIFWYELAMKAPVSPHCTFSYSDSFRTWLPHKQLAICHRVLGNKEQAFDHCNKALSYRPDDVDMIQLDQWLKNQEIKTLR
ncbi:Glycosyl transferase family 2 [Marininema halotolerans]|uniref:Glycosyl transferase family 2 n=2 Tax=Marininema halotolerans TaxID=1155944 RepID=A0A1I6TLK2_9BACL|nr:Glycosyl transferase family 2 [Marininema halotolerans]